MKTLALTVQFEDSVELRAARQLVEGAMSTIAGFRAVKTQEPQPLMPLQAGNGSFGSNAPLCVRMEFLCADQAMRNHGQTLELLAERGGLHPSEAVALNLRAPYRSLPVADALQALLQCAKPLPKGR
jgi:hypothetical protein